jgi:hypothetical protein
VTEPADAEDARIVELFADRQRFYDLAAVQRLTGLGADAVASAVEELRIRVLHHGGRIVFGWEDVASLVLERRTPREIARILVRAGRESALPALQRFRTVAIELPLYQIRLLHHLAELRRGPAPLSISDVLEETLDALAYAEDGRAREVADRAAAAWFAPFDDESYRAPGCLYCGSADGDHEHPCAACRRRHVPEEADREGER